MEESVEADNSGETKFVDENRQLNRFKENHINKSSVANHHRKLSKLFDIFLKLAFILGIVSWVLGFLTIQVYENNLQLNGLYRVALYGAFATTSLIAISFMGLAYRTQKEMRRNDFSDIEYIQYRVARAIEAQQNEDDKVIEELKHLADFLGEKLFPIPFTPVTYFTALSKSIADYVEQLGKFDRPNEYDKNIGTFLNHIVNDLENRRDQEINELTEEMAKQTPDQSYKQVFIDLLPDISRLKRTVIGISWLGIVLLIGVTGLEFFGSTESLILVTVLLGVPQVLGPQRFRTTDRDS